MNAGESSRTAVLAALMRAIHARRDRPSVLDDPWGDRLVTEREKTAIAERLAARADAAGRERLRRLGSPAAILDVLLPRHPTYASVVLRSRYAEDALARAVADGVRRYVLIGAGLDSFAVRQPPLAAGIEIVEIDHPATQASKRERLAAAGATIPANVRFVAADLSTEPLAAALARADLVDGVRTFFSWLGVTIYLTRDANRATLHGIAESAAAGSELVFNYVDERALVPGRSAEMDATRARLAAAGEPWISGFDPAMLGAELRDLGLELLEDLGGDALAARYGVSLSPSVVGHIAHARVAG